jgi:hypothetical protein
MNLHLARGPAFFGLTLDAVSISIRIFAAGKPAANLRIPLIPHRPFKLNLRFRVPSSHQLKWSLRLFQFGRNCDYLDKIVDFTNSGAGLRDRHKIPRGNAALVVQYAARQRRCVSVSPLRVC